MSRKTKNIRNIVLSDFYCTKCGHKGIPVFRTIGRERESSHLKKLFCKYCNDYENMVEIRPIGKYKIEDFYIEFKYHNFLNGERIEPNWKIFVNNILNNMSEEDYNLFLHNIDLQKKEVVI